MPPAGLIEIHNDPKQPDARACPTTGCSPTSPDATIAALVGAAGPGSGSPLVSVELRHLGGALPVDAAFSLFAVGVPVDAQAAMAIDAALARLMAATAPFDAGRALLNFTDKPELAGRLFDGHTLTGCARSRTAWTAATSSPPTTRSARRYGVGRVASSMLLVAAAGTRQATTSWFVT